MLDMRGERPKLLRNDKRANINFSAIKVLTNDAVVIVEPGSNDLVVFNSKFKEILRLQGIRGDVFGKVILLRHRGDKIIRNFE